MPLIERNNQTCAGILCLLVLASCPAVSLADVKTLECAPQNPNWPSASVDLNEGGNTVTFNWGEKVYSGGAVAPAHTDGTFPASFTAKSIAFDYVKNGNSYFSFTIDRLTGVMTVHSSINTPFDQASPDNKVVSSWDCRVESAKF